MSIFKRGNVYWYHFWFNGQHIQESTKQGNPRVARQMEAAHRTSLAKGEVGIREKTTPPLLADFADTFLKAVASTLDKRSTVEFYGRRLKKILCAENMAKARLDSIDESAIQRYIQQRQSANGGPAVATLNRELATLRRMLRLAHEWKLIERVPRIRLLRGERVRDFVLSHENEP